MEWGINLINRFDVPLIKAYLLFVCSVCASSASYCNNNDTAAYSFINADTSLLPYRDAPISFVSYFQMLKGNFVQQALTPLHVRGNDLMKTGGFALVTAGVMRADRSINDLALQLHNKSGALRTASPLITKFGGRYALFTMIGIGSWSYLVKNATLSNATLLATQSYITSGIWVSVVKFVTGRERPSYYDPITADNTGSWHGMFFQFKKDKLGNKPDGGQYSSFPSGHAAAAFSIATVYAEMYKDRPAIPILAYTGASLIGLSRITESRHWASDVLVSAALGYLCGKQVVRNFNMLQTHNSITRRKKNTLTYNFNVINRTVMPEVIYTFR